MANQPLLGQACSNLRPDLRAFSIGSYIVFCVPTSRGVQIERILHGSRDIESLF